MNQGLITAEVISCPGELGDATFSALQLNVEGFQSPYVLILALRAVGYKALAEQADPDRLLKVMAGAVNDAELSVAVKARHHRIFQGEANE